MGFAVGRFKILSENAKTDISRFITTVTLPATILQSLIREFDIRIIRDGVIIMEDKISSLRRFKDDVREVAQGYECGIGLEKCNDIQVGDILEAYIMEEVAR